MRGEVNPQSQMFSYFSPESRVPAEHPLRSIKAHTDRVLKELSGEFDVLYATTGRHSIPPEQLLKAQLLMALYTVRSDRMFCQMLDYNLLFRWFLDMSLKDEGLDQSNFSRLRERLVHEALAQRFFDAVVKIAREQNLLSSEHLTVDGTLIEAWAGAKSFKPKDGPPPPSDGRGGVDFRGSTRTNDTHGSTTDPEAMSARRGKGKEAKLCFGGHALMENRNRAVPSTADWHMRWPGWGSFNSLGRDDSGLKAGGPRPGGVCLLPADGLAIHPRHPRNLVLARAPAQQRSNRDPYRRFQDVQLLTPSYKRGSA